MNASRREFLGKAGGVAAAVAGSAARAADSPVVLGVMGVNGRGKDLSEAFLGVPGVEIGVICDVDSRAVEKCVAAVMKRQMKTPRTVTDFRRILDDPTVNALVVAAPDHWHGPATILGCQAGKHVYVEKPCCHNPREGELMIAAARRHQRIVQVGTQRRSMPGVVEAVQRIKAGEIGKVTFSRGWYSATRGTIGKGKVAPVPEWLNYDLWQGPAPEREYRDNLVHYNWHWLWHWGTGELGNNGIHALDICRWGLGVDYPIRVTSSGGRYAFDDDQQSPDTHIATFDFGGATLTWEGRSCQKRGLDGAAFGIAFYGDKGSLICDGSSYKIYDAADKEIARGSGANSQTPHLQNFVDCVRGAGKPNCDIEEGHKSTLLCHLGNIAWRTGSTLKLDPKTGRIQGNREAQALWRREYRKGWEPSV